MQPKLAQNSMTNAVNARTVQLSPVSPG